LTTTDNQFGFKPKHGTDMGIFLLKQTDNFFDFAWPTKRPGGHQSQLTMGQSLYACSAVTAAIRKGQTQL